MPSTRNSGPGLSVVAARYLEAIYYMAHEGEAVRPSRLAEWLGVRAPTVTGVVQRMRDRGYLVTAADHSLSLTDSGEEEAAEAVRRHRVVERWLADEVGLDWATADLEAGRIAHHFSSALVSRLFKRLGNFFKQKTAYEIDVRDWSQTCALPIYPARRINFDLTDILQFFIGADLKTWVGPFPRVKIGRAS